MEVQKVEICAGVELFNVVDDNGMTVKSFTEERTALNYAGIREVLKPTPIDGTGKACGRGRTEHLRKGK